MRTQFRCLVTFVMAGMLALVMGACGDPTATTAPAAAATTAPAAATTAPAAAATTAPVATTAAMMAATTAPATTVGTPAGTASGTPAGTAAAPGLTVVAGTPVGTASADAKISLKTLKLGAIPAENATKTLDNTKPFAEAMAKQLGIPVTVYVGNNYTAVIEALSSGKIDVAIFGPFSYVLATDKYGAKVIALQKGVDGSTSYNSLIITKKGSGVNTLADVKGKSFSFVDPASTSGHLVPAYTMIKAGIDPDKDIKATYAGGHDASLLGVASGKTAAGAVASDVFAKLTGDGTVSKDDIVILNTSDPIPNSPVAVRKDLSDADTAILKQAFLSINDAAALKALSTAGFQDVTDATYNGLRDIAKAENLDLTKLK